MLLKWIHKKFDKEYENRMKEVEVEEDHDDSIIQKKLDRELRKQSKKEFRRKVLIWICLVVGVIGAVKSFAPLVQQKGYEEVEAQTFVKNYGETYYKYPKDEQEQEDIKAYTLQTDWGVKYGATVEYARMEDISVYKVVVSDEVKNITSYYCYGTLISKQKDLDEVKTMAYFKIEVAKQSESYLVVRPVSNTKKNIDGIMDKDIKKTLEFEGDSSSTALEESKLEDITQTIDLFLKTYNEDIDQARLLCTDKDAMDELDSNNKLELGRVSSASSDDELIYIYAEVNETYSDTFTSIKKFYFEVEQETNKIRKMEEY